VLPDLTSGEVGSGGLVMADACWASLSGRRSTSGVPATSDRAARNYSHISAGLPHLPVLPLPHIMSTTSRAATRRGRGGKGHGNKGFAPCRTCSNRRCMAALLFVEGRWEELAHLIPSLRNPQT